MEFIENQGGYRRKFPRRAFHRRVGVLRKGNYYLAETEEIGEGGLSLVLPERLNENDEIVVNLRIPGGDFISLRATIRTVKVHAQGTIHGISFKNISFSHKRQIRSYVSARTAKEGLLT